MSAVGGNGGGRRHGGESGHSGGSRTGGQEQQDDEEAARLDRVQVNGQRIFLVRRDHLLDTVKNAFRNAGSSWVRPADHPYMAGRAGTIVEPGPDGLGSLIDDFVPAGHRFASMHDHFVDQATAIGLPDVFVNVPSMMTIFQIALSLELLNGVATRFGITTFQHRLDHDYPEIKNGK